MRKKKGVVQLGRDDTVDMLSIRTIACYHFRERDLYDNPSMAIRHIQGILTYKTTHPPRTLPSAYA